MEDTDTGFLTGICTYAIVGAREAVFLRLRVCALRLEAGTWEGKRNVKRGGARTSGTELELGSRGWTGHKCPLLLPVAL